MPPKPTKKKDYAVSLSRELASLPEIYAEYVLRGINMNHVLPRPDNNPLLQHLDWQNCINADSEPTIPLWQSIYHSKPFDIFHPVLSKPPKPIIVHTDALMAFTKSSEFAERVRVLPNIQKTFKYDELWIRPQEASKKLPKTKFHNIFEEKEYRRKDREEKKEAAKQLLSTGGMDRSFQVSWFESIEGFSVLNPEGVYAAMPSFYIKNLCYWWTYQGDRRMNEAYRLFWQQNVVVDNWLTVAAFFNNLILSAPLLRSSLIVYRGEPTLPQYAVGDILPVRRFVSTSPSLGVILDSEFINKSTKCCVYQFILPPGFPILSISNLRVSHYDDTEEELVLPATFDATGLTPTYGFKVFSVDVVKYELYHDEWEEKDLTDYLEPAKRKKHTLKTAEIRLIRCVPVRIMKGTSFVDADVWGNELRRVVPKEEEVKDEDADLQKARKKSIRQHYPKLKKAHESYNDTFWLRPTMLSKAEINYLELTGYEKFKSQKYHYLHPITDRKSQFSWQDISKHEDWMEAELSELTEPEKGDLVDDPYVIYKERGASSVRKLQSRPLMVFNEDTDNQYILNVKFAQIHNDVCGLITERKQAQVNVRSLGKELTPEKVHEQFRFLTKKAFQSMDEHHRQLWQTRLERAWEQSAGNWELTERLAKDIEIFDIRTLRHLKPSQITEADSKQKEKIINPEQVHKSFKGLEEDVQSGTFEEHLANTMSVQELNEWQARLDEAIVHSTNARLTGKLLEDRDIVRIAKAEKQKKTERRGKHHRYELRSRH